MRTLPRKNLGLALFGLKRYPEAISYLERVLEDSYDLDPECLESFLMVCIYDLQEGKAIHEFRKAFRQHGDLPAGIKLSYIHALVSLGRFEDAGKFMSGWEKRSNTYDEDDGAEKLAIFAGYISVTDLRNAERVFRTLNKDDCNNPVILLTAARMYKDMGRFKEALTIVKKLIALQPADPELWQKVSSFAGYTGDPRLARDAWQRVTQIVPSAMCIDPVMRAMYFSPGDPDSGITSKSFQIAAAAVIKGTTRENVEASHKKTKPLRETDAQADIGEKPQLFEGILDLRLSPKNERVAVLEMGGLYRAGLTGYARAYGYDLITRHLDAFHNALQRQWWAYGSTHGFRLMRPNIIPQFNDYLRGGTEEKLVISCANLAFIACTEYKDALFFRVAGNPVLRPYIPKTCVLPLSRDGIGRIGDEITDEWGEYVVVKPVDQLHGNGVTVLPRAELGTFLERILGCYQNDEPMDGTSLDYWRTNGYPNIVVQELVSSDPVLCDDGVQRDGTMRMAFSVVLGGFGEVTGVKCHGAYWKLPGHGVDSQDIQARTVSLAPTKIGQTCHAAFRAQPLSARVSPEDFAFAESHLTTFLREFSKSLTRTPEDYVRDLISQMQDGSEEQQASALVRAVESTTGDVTRYLLPDSLSRACTKSIRDLIENCPEKAGPAAIRRMLDTAENLRVINTMRQYADTRRIGRSGLIFEIS